ncbi:MAG: hypothetical protein K6G69_03180 [Lachnospiraceae bacterium]|nr:hypothetical protein [Lachnospiraceae bacterium]
MKVVVGASAFDENGIGLEKYLSENGIEVIKNPYGRRLTLEETIEHVKEADGLLAGLEPLNEEVFQKADRLKAIARIGIGMDNVDKEAAKRYGIKVSNTPEGPTSAVAEMTLSALLCICHNIVWANNDIHNGRWTKRMGHSIAELKIFVVGYGHIGRRTSDLLAKMGAEVSIYDKYNPEVTTCEFEEGLKKADVISLHASGKDEIISSDMFSLIRDGVIILNSARGSLINEQALYEALNSGKVGAFWGDAFWNEPYTGILTQCENAILTPHISTYTSLCRNNMEKQAVDNLLRDLL